MPAEYERMLDPSEPPPEGRIKEYLGREAFGRLGRLEEFLYSSYRLCRELKFPFGNGYGWGYKYSQGGTLLCYIFFERGAFSVTVSIGKESVPRLSAELENLLPKTREAWRNRYPCGEGGWVHYRVLSEEERSDVQKLIGIRKKPVRKR